MRDAFGISYHDLRKAWECLFGRADDFLAKVALRGVNEELGLEPAACHCPF